MKKILGLLGTLFCGLSSFANTSLYDVKVNNVRLYDKFVQQGAPKSAVERVFEFLDINGGKTVKVEAKVRTREKTYLAEKDIKIQEKFVAIIDFSRPSNEKRLFVMNLKTGEVSKHLVAHGKGSGVVVPAKFSNIGDSKMTSLGLYLAGDTYIGKHGKSLNLYGLEPSNSKAARRDIVMHAANYVSEDFAKARGRIGRSWGCPAVAPGIIGKMINIFQGGGLIYAYHKEVTAKTLKNPNLQVVKVDNDDVDVDLPGEEETLRKGETETGPLSDEAVAKRLSQVERIPIPLPRPHVEELAPTTNAEPVSPSSSQEPTTVKEAITAGNEVVPVEPEVMEGKKGAQINQ